MSSVRWTPVLRRITASFAMALTAALMGTLGAAAGDQKAPPGWRTVTYRGAAVSVPSGWPIYDLSRDVRRCARLDVHAVYLGHQGADATCPTRIIGRSVSVHLEPLDSASAGTAGRATRTATLDGQQVLVDPSSDTNRQLVTSLPGTGALVSISYGQDRATAQQIAGTLHVTGSRAGRQAPVTATPAQRLRPATAAASGSFVGSGFDTCAAPSAGAMQAWLGSPYRAVGIYIGGENRGCPDGNLSASWVSQVAGLGWSFIPLYVGLQAPCDPHNDVTKIDPNNASAQGVVAADDAASRAQAFGLGAGMPIFNDMEGYGSGCSGTVMAFLAAWSSELHLRGYASGVYSSLASGIADLVNTPSARPDEIDFAKWDGAATTSDPAIPGDLWANHQRIKQYLGGHDETYNGITIGIDTDSLDATLAGAPTSALPGSQAANDDQGKMTVFFRSQAQTVAHNWQTFPHSGPWAGWLDLGSSILSEPVAALDSAGKLCLFAIDANGHLQHNYQVAPHSGWNGWVDLGGGTLTGRPAVTLDGAGRLVVFARTTSGTVAYTFQTAPHSGPWSAWTDLGGSIAGDPAAALDSVGKLTLFAVDAAGHLQHDYQNAPASDWHGWIDLGGGNLTGTPAAANDDQGKMTLFVRTTSGTVAHNWQTFPHSGPWAGWIDLGGFIASDPAAALDSAGKLTLFAVDANGHLQHNYQVAPHSSWNGWLDLGGSLVSVRAPAVALNSEGKLCVFAVAPDGSLQQVFQTFPHAGPWSSWTNLGGGLSPNNP